MIRPNGDEDVAEDGDDDDDAGELRFQRNHFELGKTSTLPH